MEFGLLLFVASTPTPDRFAHQRVRFDAQVRAHGDRALRDA